MKIKLRKRVKKSHLSAQSIVYKWSLPGSFYFTVSVYLPETFITSSWQ